MKAKRFRPLTWASRIFLTVHPTWALIEMWLLGLLLLLVLSRLAGAIPRAALSNGTLLMCGVCGLWAVFRARLPQNVWWKQILGELAMGAAVSLIMVAGLGLPARWLGWDVAWRQSTMGTGVASLVRFMTGFGYLAARIGIRLWLFWNRLRRRRMLWAMTHAHLTTAFVVMMIACIAFVASALLFSSETQSESLDLAASFATRLLHTIFPAVSVMVIFSLLGLAVVMPPSAVFSFFVARRTTRRLKDLADAAKAWRAGNYDARVEVRGQDEVAQLQADLNVMADELARTMSDLETERDTVAQLLQARRELVANVSHELRTPVATMRAMLESTLAYWQDDPPSTLRHDLDVMQGEIQRLQTLIDDLFTLSQAEVDRLTLDCLPISVGPVVQRLVDAMASFAWQSGRLHIATELPAGLPLVCADSARLEQILANLVRNAIRHTPPGGIIAVATEAEADFVRIEVRDTGQGIAATDLPYIWDRFYRGANHEEDHDSAGLGLAIVKELTEAMGGTVAVESTVDQGSCFAIRLPINKP